MTRLIVNADDFGQTSGINRAVLELHKAGPAHQRHAHGSRRGHRSSHRNCARNANSRRRLPHRPHRRRTGPPARADPFAARPSTNFFIPGLTVFVGRLFSGRIRAEEIEAEATAQIQYLQSRGVHVDHVDTHKHTHMFPRVLRPVLRGARACGIRVVRNPFEPIWAIRATASTGFVRAAEVSSLRCLQSTWHRIVAEEGFATTGGTLGVTGTGALDVMTLHRLLDRVPAGTWELVTHPGYNDADLARVQTRLRASREIERKALPALRGFSALHLIPFSELAPQH